MSLIRSLDAFRTRQGWSGILRTFGTALIALIGIVALLSFWPSDSRSSALDPQGPWTVPVKGEWTPLITDESYAAFDGRADDRDATPFEEHALPLDPPPWEENSHDNDRPVLGEAGGEETEESPPPTTREYVVRRNDSFWRIADRELGSGLRHEEILDWNPKLKGKTLHAGMTLVLPIDGSTPRRGGGSISPDPLPRTPLSHTVARGENLTKIARLYGVTPEAIFESNRSRLRSIDHVTVGKKLTIPTPRRSETRGVSGRSVAGRSGRGAG